MGRILSTRKAIVSDEQDSVEDEALELRPLLEE
jgi:hypothetical protein